MTVADTPDTHPSKLQNPDQKGYVNRHGLSRKHIFAAVDASLERLGLDYIDVLQCHRFVSGLSLRVPDRCKLESGLTSPVVLQDPETPIEETMDALDAIVKMGKVRYIGMSSCYAYQFHQMQAYAKSRNQTCFISMQDLQVELDFLAAG